MRIVSSRNEREFATFTFQKLIEVLFCEKNGQDSRENVHAQQQQQQQHKSHSYFMATDWHPKNGIVLNFMIELKVIQN